MTADTPAPQADTREDAEGLPERLWVTNEHIDAAYMGKNWKFGAAMVARRPEVGATPYVRADILLAAESALAEARAEIERIKAAFDAYHASVMGNLRALLTPSHTPSQPRSEADDDLGPVTAEGMAMVRERAAAGLAGRTFSSIYASQPRSDSLSGGDGAGRSETAAEAGDAP